MLLSNTNLSNTDELLNLYLDNVYPGNQPVSQYGQTIGNIVDYIIDECKGNIIKYVTDRFGDHYINIAKNFDYSKIGHLLIREYSRSLFFNKSAYSLPIPKYVSLLEKYNNIDILKDRFHKAGLNEPIYFIEDGRHRSIILGTLLATSRIEFQPIAIKFFNYVDVERYKSKD